MKRWIFFLMMLLGMAMPFGVWANFDQSSIRLDNNKAGVSPERILVTAKMQNSVGSDKVRIKFGDSWILLNDYLSFKVSTASLPDGVVAWSGIGDALNKNGNLVEFPSGSLLPWVTYGFYITGGFTQNPAAGSSDGYKWQIDLIKLGVVLETAKLKVPVVTNNTISITGTVPAKPSDFRVNLTNDQTGQINQGGVINYQLDYGTFLNVKSKSLKIMVEWSQGSIVGSETKVDILDYVLGSAGVAYGNTPAVIDLENRRITWQINNFPVSTNDNRVSFSLKTTGNYTGKSEVGYSVKAWLVWNDSVTSGIAATSGTYVYNPPPPEPTLIPTSVPTVINTPAPTGSLANTVSATPQITPTLTTIPQKPIIISKIEIESKTWNQASVRLSLSQEPEMTSIRYGISPAKMDKKLVSLSQLRNQLFTLTDLKSVTQYYFQIETNREGKSSISDIFVFETAQNSEIPQLIAGSLKISSQDSVVYEESAVSKGEVVVLTIFQDYAVQLKLNKPETIKQIKLFVRNKKVLGVNSWYGSELNMQEAGMLQLDNGLSVGRLKGPAEVGYYELMARIADFSGNIAEHKIADLKIVNPIRVVDQSGNGVEKIKANFYIYDPKNQLYVYIPTKSLGFSNPVYSGYDGIIWTNLPKGSYRVELTATGYQGRTVEFKLGQGDDEIYPLIVIKRATGIWSIVSYYWRIADDGSLYVNSWVQSLAESKRVIEMVKIGLILILFILVSKATSKKLGIPWLALLGFVGYLIWSRLTMIKKSTDIIYGRIVDKKTKAVVGGAEIFLIDSKLNKILARTISNRLGNFRLKYRPASSYKIAVIKGGYVAGEMADYTNEGLKASDLLLRIEEADTLKFRWRQLVESGIFHFVGIAVELLMIMTAVLVAISALEIGTKNMIPYLVVAVANLVIWLIYNYELSKSDKTNHENQ